MDSCSVEVDHPPAAGFNARQLVQPVRLQNATNIIQPYTSSTRANRIPPRAPPISSSQAPRTTENDSLLTTHALP